METIYIKSAGFNVNPTQQSVFKFGNKGYVLTRGINIIYINNSNNIQHSNYDTYAHNLESQIIENLKQAYNTSVNTIIIAIHDDGITAISGAKIQQQLSFLNMNLFKHLKFRHSYLLVFDNVHKKLVSEDISPNNIIERSYSYDVNKKMIISSNVTKYVCCTKWMYKFFIEYVESFANTFNLKLLLADDLNTINYDPNAIYVFCQSIPSAIIDSPIKKILINTEQATIPERREPCLAAIKRNIPVIDYAPENIQVLNSPLVNYLPYQHTGEIHKLYTFLNVPKQYDVAFCGTASPKRKAVLDQLVAKGISVHIIDGWGDVRDKEIGKCKILLNIHYHDTYNIYESIRCDRETMAGMLIVSETSINNSILDIANLVIFEPYHNLVAKVTDVIKNYDIYQTEFVNKHAASINQIKTNRYNQMMAVKSKFNL